MAWDYILDRSNTNPAILTGSYKLKHRYDKALVILLSGLLSTGCMFLTETQPEQAVYSGTGGMSEYSITPQVYLYHYENGFSGTDALGWEPELQYAWSRIGAAITCKIPLDKQQMIYQLGFRFGHKHITHELNGIGFHAVKAVKYLVSVLRSGKRRYQS